MLDFSLTALELVLLILVLAFAIVQIFYYLIAYMRPFRNMQQSSKTAYSTEKPPVSIIVYAKNESKNLEKHLPVILTQDYPQYEVIVINDGSTDESDDVLMCLEQIYPNLYHTFTPQESKYLSRRKLSLTLGIKAAKHDILFFVEATCVPMSDKWLSSMMRNYNENTMILLGYSAYTARKGFLHKLIGYDNLMLGVQYLSSALAGRPYSGSGRNLSYRKKLFFEHKGFSHSLNLHAGDDDLFVNELATKANTRVEYSPDSITEMSQLDYSGMWTEIKVSLASTQRHYRGSQLLFYRMETVSAVLFLLSFAASIAVGLLNENYYMAALASLFYILLYIVKAIVLGKLAVMLRQKKFTFWLPFLEIARIYFNAYILIYRTFKGKHDYTFTLGGKNSL